MPFKIIRNDIVNMQADAIVNTANPYAVIGEGVDSALHQKAGSGLLKAREAVGTIAVGQAAVTPAFNLDAKYVIHTVGPIWQDGTKQEELLLQNCYKHSLELAAAYGCESIAFPLISSGNYGFPKELALQTAITMIRDFLVDHEMMVCLVVFDHTAYALSGQLFHAVESYIDERYAEAVEGTIQLAARDSGLYNPVSTSGGPRRNLRRIRREHDIEAPALAETRRLADLLEELDDTFSESLLRIIDRQQKKDSEVYKKANIDRKLFSKIRSNRDYRPSKATAIALSIALELNLDEIQDLIGRAGYTLTHSSKFDVIIEYFVVQGNYDIYEINEVLFAFEQPLIGA